MGIWEAMVIFFRPHHLVVGLTSSSSPSAMCTEEGAYWPNKVSLVVYSGGPGRLGRPRQGHAFLYYSFFFFFNVFLVSRCCLINYRLIKIWCHDSWVMTLAFGFSIIWILTQANTKYSIAAILKVSAHASGVWTRSSLWDWGWICQIFPLEEIMRF